MTRAFLIVPVVLAGWIASPISPPARHRLHFLHIGESAGYSTKPSPSRRRVCRRAQETNCSQFGIVAPPVTMEIADSIQRIHVVASGIGSVHVTLVNPEAPGDSLVSVGRDITLVRKQNEPFRRIWTVQPLLP
jgi:hypothetical protein